MYICSILKCCILSNNEITPYINKSSSIVERHIAGVVNLIARTSLSPIDVYSIRGTNSPHEKQNCAIFIPLLCISLSYCFIILNYSYTSNLYMNDVF